MLEHPRVLKNPPRLRFDSQGQRDFKPVRLMPCVSKQPSMYFTPMVPWHQSEEKNCFEDKVLQWRFLQGLKRSLSQLVQHQGQVLGKDSPTSLGTIPVKTLQEMNEIFILSNMKEDKSQLIWNSWPVTIDCARLKILLEQVQEVITGGNHILYWWCSEVYLLKVAALS